MKRISGIDEVEGWLVDPNQKWSIHFYKGFTNSLDKTELITIDMWGVIRDGAPSQFKSRRKVKSTEAIKILNQLIDAGWKNVKGKLINAA